MRGTGGLKSLPPPRPPAGPHLSWHRDARRPRCCGSAWQRPRVSAGLGALSFAGWEGRVGKSPRPAHKFRSRRVWAPQQGTPVSWRGCRLGSPAKFRG